MILRLKEIRKSKGITQTFMAKSLGFKSVSGYNAIEIGRVRLDLERAIEIAKILDVPVRSLLSE